MKAPYRIAILFLGMVLSFVGLASAGDEPQGLLLRKGLVGWQASVAEARKSIEENIRPNTVQLLANQKPLGFGCEREAAAGVVHCNWACCVDLGEKDTVHFSTLWFYDDRFYAYDVAFNTALFPGLYAALVQKFGKPSKETQETRMAPALLVGGLSSYTVDTKRWDEGDTVVLLEDRGGEGKPLVGHIYVAYMPLFRQAVPARKEDNQPAVKLPF